VELLRILAAHPHAELTAITSRKEDGMPVAEMFPSLRGFVSLAFSAPEKTPLHECDVVFFATPHGVAMAQARELLATGVKVIDLAADFRLKDIVECFEMPNLQKIIQNENTSYEFKIRDQVKDFNQNQFNYYQRKVNKYSKLKLQ
jgi:N-acetyl-gamma-glutamylphosphate reductase